MTGQDVPIRRALLAPLSLLTCFGILALGACDQGDLPTALGPDEPAFQVASAPVVNSLADPGDGTCDDAECTLREAIAFADTGATITFSVTGTITLAGSTLLIAKDLTLSGPGASSLAIHGNGIRRVLWTDAAAHKVTISGLTITGGYVTTSGGAGIWNSTNLTVTDCAITGNNATTSPGGGIYNRGTLLVVSTTISGNLGHDIAGGVYSESTSATFLNSTLSGNLKFDGTPGVALYNSGLVRVIHSTITGNSTGVLAYTGSSTEVKGSIVWGNLYYDVDAYTTGIVSSLGHNLVGTAYNASFGATGDQTAVTDALIGPLQLNSPGTTATHALLTGSPALDAGTCTDHTGATVTTDQRGVTRPQGAACDIGAYEKETSASAATEVNTLEDHDDGSCDTSDCTLREAIAYADAGATITFSVTGTITLSGTELSVTKDLTITGPGANSLTVNGNGLSRVFNAGSFTNLSISGLTITGGRPTDTGGAGILSLGETLTITDCAITGNNAYPNPGGAIRNGGAALTVRSSTISGNTAVSIYGGGIYTSSARPATILNSTISGNGGGGIYSAYGTVQIVQSTVTGHATGVYTDTDGHTQVMGSVIWGNSSSDVDAESAGHFSSLGYNLIGTGSLTVVLATEFAATGDQTGITDAKLGTLQLNAPGTTATHELLAGSPALDAGTCTDHTGATVAADQRGVTRPQGSGCDIGAYELESTGGLLTPTFTFDLSGLSKTYGDPEFTVAGSPYVTTNSTGDVTFALGSGSVGCSLTAETVTIIGAATGSSYCIIEATLAADGTYAGAGPESAQFNIARATTTVAIANIPTSGLVGGGFTPTYTTDSDGLTSVVSNTPAVCTVSGGDVSFIAAGTCTLQASVAQGTNWLAATGSDQSVTVGAATPTFTFDLSGLSKTYGDPDFTVAGSPYVTTNSTGEVTFVLGSGSVGCSVTTAGIVTITGAATGSSYCIVEATLAANATYTGAGPESGQFNIARAATTVSIANMPASALVGGGFTPTYTTTSDGAKSVASTTTDVCTVSGGDVSFIATGTCTLQASVAQGTNWLAATGEPQSVTIVQGTSDDFTSSCTFRIHPRSHQLQVNITWENADPAVTLLELVNGVTVTKEITPTATGSWSVNLKNKESDELWYQLSGAARKKDAPTPLMELTACTGLDAPGD